MLDKLYAKLSTEYNQIDDELYKILQDQNTLIQNINDDVLSSPGKRLRPLMMVLASKSLNPDTLTDQQKDHLNKLAAAIELIHTASLVHDDVIDQAPLRHDKPTIHTQYDEATAITMGVYLYSKSLALIAQVGNVDALSVFSTAVTELCRGELTQIMTRGQIDLDMDTYITILEQKTAVLFKAAVEVGSIIVGSDKNQRQALIEYGKNFGMVFQLLDDYKDLTSSSEQLHKNPVQDLSMGELTFPLIMLMSKATPEDQDRLTHIFQNKEIDQIDWILEKLSEYAISEEISTLVRTYLNNAQSALSNIPDNDYKDCLNSLVEATREKLNDVVYQ